MSTLCGVGVLQTLPAGVAILYPEGYDLCPDGVFIRGTTLADLSCCASPRSRISAPGDWIREAALPARPSEPFILSLAADGVFPVRHVSQWGSFFCRPPADFVPEVRLCLSAFAVSRSGRCFWCRKVACNQLMPPESAPSCSTIF